jgi:hypothetical protein
MTETENEQLMDSSWSYVSLHTTSTPISNSVSLPISRDIFHRIPPHPAKPAEPNEKYVRGVDVFLLSLCGVAMSAVLQQSTA